MNCYEEFRTNLIKACENVDERNFLLCLSGGMDSTTELFAILRNSVRPTCITFNLGDELSEDTKSAIKVCEVFEVPHEIIKIPRNEETLVKDVETLICHGFRYATSIQCSQPFLYLAKHAMMNNIKVLLTGLGADPIFGSGRRASMIYHKGGEKAFKELRKDYDPKNATRSTVSSILYTCRLFDVNMQSPYFNPIVYKPVLELKHSQIWKGKLKYICYKAFEEEYKKLGFTREQQSFQIISGIRDWHNTLIKSKHNKRDNLSVIGVYHDMKADLIRRGYNCNGFDDEVFIDEKTDTFD